MINKSDRCSIWECFCQILILISLMCLYIY
uniref:Uncharacterized protein n=1 Tax=Anguilla anguilla TaxID=7936 RepID=A0A0E9TWF2_ANGAN